MLTGIDHLVIVVPDLSTAIRDYTELGFNVVEGGLHPVGTHNGLISFSDGAYIELIAFYKPNVNHRWWQPLQQGGGLVDFCVGTDDLISDTAAFRSAGVDIADPTPQSRRRPDGYELHWIFSLARAAHRGVVPFIIEDITPREERIPRATPHPNEVTGIASVTIAVNNLQEVRHWYAESLRQEGKEIAREDLGAVGVGFAVGPHTIEVMSPIPGSSGNDQLEPLHEWLERWGPSPYSGTMHSLVHPREPLDTSKSHNALLFLVGPA
jgi:catechol 2,3-dioxygenase-like lactoylglutathione lyase family enzyme